MKRLPHLYKVTLLSISISLALAGCTHGSSKIKIPSPTSLEPGVGESLSRGVKALLLRQHADDGSWGGDDVKVQSSHKSDYPVAISSLAYLAR
jgi:hypothetical protein